MTLSPVIDFEWRSYGLGATPTPPPPPADVAYGSSGWRYQLIAETASGDRSGIDYDDSTWLTGSGAFGNALAAEHAALGWPAPATVTPVDTRLWLRRRVGAVPGSSVTIQVRVDGAVAVYWNGVLVADPGQTWALSNGASVVIAGADVSDDNILAVRFTDDLADPGGDFFYADVSLTQVAPGTTGDWYRDAVLASAPQVYPRVGEASGTVMADSSGNARHGTYAGLPGLGVPSLVATQTDTAFSPTATNARGQVPYGSWLNQASMSVEAWIKTTSSAAASIVCRDIQSGTRCWQLSINAGKVVFTVIAGAIPIMTGIASINDGLPHHVVLTYDGVTAKLYIDGALDKSQALNQALNLPTATPLTIGNTNRSSVAPFPGTIDEVAFYAGILSAATVAAHHTAGVTPPAPPDPEPEPDPVVGWIIHLERSDALLSYAVTGYGRADATARTTPVQVSVTLSAGVAGDPPQVGERFRLQLSDGRAADLGLTEATGAVRFTGEVTDHVHDPNAGPSGTYTVTGVGRLGRASRRRAQPKWGQHDDGDRAARIIAAAGVDAGTVDAGVVQVLPQLEPATIAQLMDTLTDSTGGAFVEQLTGNVDYHDAEHRRDQPVGLVLAAGEIVNDLQWEQHVGDVLNELEVTYGQPQARLQVVDHYSVDELDPFAGTLNTILVDASDAHSIGSRLVARRAWPAWQLPGLLVQLHKRDDVKLAQLLGLKHGDRIKVTGVPAGAHPYAGDVEFFVEGLAETATRQAWRMAIAVSDPARAGVDIRWIDVPEGLTWSEVDPTLTWRDVALIQDPNDLEA